MKRLSFVLLFTFAIVTFAPEAHAQGGPMPTCSMTAEPGVIQKGGTVNLRWETQNAVAGTITSIGSVGPSGTQGVIPTQTTEYVGIFTGAAGSVRCAVTVIVTLPQGGTTQPAASPAGTAQPAGTAAPGQSTQTPLPQSPDASPGSNISIEDPLGGAGLVPCSGLNCQACHLAQLVQRVINFLILISVPLAAILIAVAGAMLFSSGAIDTKAKAKAVLKNALVGFLIAITSWLVINTILNILLDPAYKQGGNWFSIQCVDQRARPMSGSINDFIKGVLGELPAPTQVGVSPTGQGGLFDTSNIPNASLTHASAQQQFSAAGIGVVSSGNCSDGSNPNCTSFDGLQQALANNVVFLKQDCNCSITVTGGTETGHAGGTYTHSNGYKIDLDVNQQLSSYITNHPQAVPGSLGSYSTYTIGKFIYMNEGNHWDVQYKP